MRFLIDLCLIFVFVVVVLVIILCVCVNDIYVCLVDCCSHKHLLLFSLLLLLCVVCVCVQRGGVINEVCEGACSDFFFPFLICVQVYCPAFPGFFPE